MMKWLQDNPLGVALSAVCGLLLGVLLVLAILSSLPLSLAPEDSLAGVTDAGLELPVLASNKPLDAYQVITERPLFNAGRLPILDDLAEDEDSLIEPDADGEIPEVELAGVIITPSLRMVTLKRKDNALSLVAFEGKPIEADFGSWRVSRILPRAATLTSAGGEELQLELMVHDARIEPPDRTSERDKKAAQSANSTAAADSAAEPLSRAEEIRQRIAERREELQREAEQAESDSSGEQAQKPNYRQVIQSMVGRKRQTKSDEE